MSVGLLADRLLATLVLVYLVCIASSNHVLACFMDEDGCTFTTGFGLDIGSKLMALLYGLDFMLVMTWFVQVEHCNRMVQQGKCSRVEVNWQSKKLQMFKA